MKMNKEVQDLYEIELEVLIPLKALFKTVFLVN